MIIDRYIGRGLDDLKRDEGAMRECLSAAGDKEFRGRNGCCPFCDDKHPSAGIYSANGDGFGFKCQKCLFGGSIIDVIAKIDGIDDKEVCRRIGMGTGGRPSEKKPSGPPKVYPTIESLGEAYAATIPDYLGLEETDRYIDPVTRETEMVVFRFLIPDGKTFRQGRPERGGWAMKAPPAPRPLFNRVGIATTDTVIVVEGEKKVRCLHEYGIVATTSPCGAPSAKNADWGPVAGKHVTCWRDNDDSGFTYERDAIESMRRLDPPPRISIIDPTSLGLEKKGDVVDFVEGLKVLGWDHAKIQWALKDAIGQAKLKSTGDELDDYIEDAIAGKRRTVKWPWACMGGLTKALKPGAVVTWCGSPGASKSFALLQAMAYWHEAGVKVAVYELQDNKAFHLARALAQRTGLPGFTDEGWVEDHPEQARAAKKEHEAFFGTFKACVFTKPAKQLTLKDLVDWVRERAGEGCRVVAIDPITAVEKKAQGSWEQDNTFMDDIERIAQQHGCSVIVVTHPKGIASVPDLNYLAGGQAYSRASQTILWLENHDKKTSTVKMACGTIEAEHDRTLRILKSRSGKGTGIKLAFEFDSESLTLKELGIILREK